MTGTETEAQLERQFFAAVGVLTQDPKRLDRVLAYARAVLGGDHERAKAIEADIRGQWLILEAMGPDRCFSDDLDAGGGGSGA